MKIVQAGILAALVSGSVSLLGAPCDFARLAPSSPSPRPGFGALPFDAGTSFRVWAPNAERVFVVGDFNGWDPEKNELAKEENGNFSGVIREARPGQKYKFVIVRGNDRLFRTDPRAEAIGEDNRGVIVDQAAFGWQTKAFTPPPPQAQVIYELHLGTFHAEEGKALGTWKGAAEKLEYLKSLGVNMIEVLPVSDFPGEKSWGYNPVHPFAPARAYGSVEDMKAFIDRAHALGMGVILDVVYNHWDSSGDLWRFDGESYGFGGIYFYDDWRGKTPWGARPNFGRPEVRDYIFDNAMMWLRDYRVDGLRCDSTCNMHAANGTPIPEGWQLLQRVADEVRAKFPGKILIAEDLQRNAAITRPTSAGGAGFQAQWDPGFYWPLLGPVVTSDDRARDLNAVRAAILNNYNGDATQRIIYTANHDEVGNLNGKVRLPNKIDPNDPEDYWARKRSQLAAGILLTSPGVPMLFQGQELLETGSWGDQLMDWGHEQRFAGNLALYRDLIALRRNARGTTAGLTGQHTEIFHQNDAAKVIAYHRWSQGGPGDDVVVIANLSAQPLRNYYFGLPRAGRWETRFNSDWTGYGPDYGNGYSGVVDTRNESRDGMPYSGSTDLGPYSVVILSQSN